MVLKFVKTMFLCGEDAFWNLVKQLMKSWVDVVIVGVLCPLAKSLVVVIYLSGGIFPAVVVSQHQPDGQRWLGRWQQCLRRPNCCRLGWYQKSRARRALILQEWRLSLKTMEKWLHNKGAYDMHPYGVLITSCHLSWQLHECTLCTGPAKLGRQAWSGHFCHV